MLNPLIRAKRLRAEFDRVRKLHESGGLVAIEQVVGDPPDHYIVRYTCRGIMRLMGTQPVYGDLHRVVLHLTATYPNEQPQMEWLTPIFHPNIKADGSAVCIGTWFPAKTLDQLLLMLGEMIQYRNYAAHDPLHLEASLWAMEHKNLFPIDDRMLLEPNRHVETNKSSRPTDDMEIVFLG